MVVLKHVVAFMASLATLGAASPASAQWQRPDASATGIAHYGKPSGTAAGGGIGIHDSGDWQHSPTGYDEEGEHGNPFKKNDDSSNTTRHQARDEDAPTQHRAFSSYRGAGASQNLPEGKEESEDTYKQHHARSDDVLETLRRMAQQEDDHDNHGDNHGYDHDMEDGSHSQTESGEHGNGKQHDTRTTTERGVYECSGQNWQQPCVWTPLKDGQCYNRLYGRLGSMGPDNGLSCTIYERPDCNDHGWNTCGPFVYPGIPNYQTSHLLLYNGMSDDGIFSIKCKYT